MTTTTTDQLISRLKLAGVIARLPGDLPLQTTTPLIDALLASPIQAVEVTYENPETFLFISDLAQRANGNLIIGVSGMDTAVSPAPLTETDTAYITSSQFNHNLHTTSHAANIPYIPSFISLIVAQKLAQEGHTLLHLRTGGPDGPAFVTAIRHALPDVALLVSGEINSENIVAYVATGATAVIIDNIWQHPQQPMSEIITHARTLQKKWHTQP